MAPAAHQHLHQKLGSQHSASGITLAMETTSETIESSADASIDSSTPFHFTSFPASLPRVNNLPLRHAPSSTVKEISSGVQTESICGPPSVRKRMSFGSVLTGDRSGHNATASQDTSFSSLPLDSGDENAETHHRSGMNPQHLVAEASHADHPADTSTTGTGTPVPRARLNFSSVTSPKMNDALDHRGTDAKRIRIERAPLEFLFLTLFLSLQKNMLRNLIEWASAGPTKPDERAALPLLYLR
jgi:hypothetical protein